MDPSIEGTASSTGPQGIATAGPVGVDHSMGFQPSPHGSQLPTGPKGIAAAGPWIHPRNCIESRPAAANRLGVDHPMELQPGPQGIAAAGPVGVDHSMGFQLGPNGSQLPTGPQGIAAAGHGLQTSAYFRPWDPGLCIMPAHGSRELHRVPARRGSQLLARSALITRSNSNQVPMDPGLCILLALGSIEGTALSTGPQGSQLQPGPEYFTRWNSNPARRGSQLLARSALITRWDSNQVPMDHNCQPARRGLHHAGPARSRSISRRSQLLALGSKVVHTAGPGIHLGNCIEYRPAAANRLGVLHSMELQPGPQGIATANRLGVD